VTFLAVPPNCTYTHSELVSKIQLMFFFVLGCEPKQGEFDESHKTNEHNTIILFMLDVLKPNYNVSSFQYVEPLFHK